MAKRLHLTEQIRRLIDGSGLTRYRICKEIGLAESTMSRFMSGHCGLSFETLDKLGELLDLQITSGKSRKE